ncbi:RHS repeat protein [Chryseobacterium sp. Tr-659]|uniref:RHS repeat protein n=1 Tax=Chryseobacterium sp. Tr-659 TaxID=2608340 RepID=UPI001423685B|nr:RHS repeat protein [Chryseobacterium sp. Tr-659]NIF03889.1 RHS repeat protein [Chryseobacterium sp. Tr-659]
MNKSIIFFLFFTTSAVLCKAQTYWLDMQTINANRPKVSKPEASGLTDFKISDQQVDLSTGTINPSLAITDISTKSLSENVTLIYDKGKGIRVNDIASDAGLGWEVQAGGYITRKVNGFPDDISIYTNAAVGVAGTISTPMPNKQKSINGWLDYANWNPKIFATPYNGTFIMAETPYNNQSLGGAIQGLAMNIKNDINVDKFRSLLAQPVAGPAPNISNGYLIADLAAMLGVGWQILNVDGEPDEFYFKIGKYSGKFVFDGNRNPVTIPYIPGLKIKSPFGSTDNKWIITTPEGVVYTLPNTPEYTEKLYSETETTPEHDDSWGVHTPDRNEGIDANEYTSKWYVSKMEGVSGDYIDYKYETLPDLIYSEKSFIKQKFFPGWGFTINPPNYFIYSGDPGFTERELPRNTDFKLKSPKRISAITTSDQNKITLIYNGLERQDINQSQNGNNKRKSLSSVEKYDFNNTRISKMEFLQSYFTGSCNDYTCKRLKLNTLKLIGRSNDQIASTDFEYNMSEALPSRNAFQQDFWGYFNDNTAMTLVPEVISTSYGYNYSGANRRPSENRTKAGILTKIIYPTKGSISYEYELNDFNTGGASYITNNKTGGLRIKNIIKKENSQSLPITTAYKYLLPNGQTSGEIHPELLQVAASFNNNGAGRLTEIQKITVNENNGNRSRYMVIYSSPKYMYTDDLIRYSRVVAETDGKGKKEYTLSAFSTNPDDNKVGKSWKNAGVSNGGFILDPLYFSPYFSKYDTWPAPTIHHPDKSYMRGLILNIKEKDNNGILLKEIDNHYQINPSGFTPVNVYSLGVSSSDIFLAENSEVSKISYEVSKFTGDYVFMNDSTVKDYQNTSNTIISSLENNSFNSLCFLSDKNVKYSDNNLMEVKYKYPTDKQINKLILANIISEPVETEVKKNGTTISKHEIIYDNSSHIYPSSILVTDLIGNTTTEITYDQYDAKGNLAQYTDKNGLTTSIIWGYKKSQPIAKIEGAKLADIQQSLIDLIVNASNTDALAVVNNDETSFLSDLNTFRNSLSNYQITTYTYDPLIGIRSITSPSGIRDSYIYDSTGRLEKIVDVNGQIVKEMKYNYKN